MRTLVLLLLGFVCFVGSATAQSVDWYDLRTLGNKRQVERFARDFEISRRDQLIGKGGVTIAGGLVLTYFGSRRLIRHIRTEQSEEYTWLDNAADLVFGYLGVAIGTVGIIAGTVYLVRGLNMPKQQGMNIGFEVGEAGHLAVQLTARW